MSEQLIEEYTAPSGQTITLTALGGHFEVACWNVDQTNHWTKDYIDADEANKEFERWRK